MVAGYFGGSSGGLVTDPVYQMVVGFFGVSSGVVSCHLHLLTIDTSASKPTFKTKLFEKAIIPSHEAKTAISTVRILTLASQAKIVSPNGALKRSAVDEMVTNVD